MNDSKVQRLRESVYGGTRSGSIEDGVRRSGGGQSACAPAMDVEERPAVDRAHAAGSANSSESGRSKRSDRSTTRLNNAANLSRKQPAKTYHKNCFISNDLGDNKYFKKSADFLDGLDAKLRDLEPQNGKKKKTSSLENRPMFITTVKTGIFLDPPPDIAALLGLRHSSSSASSANGTDLLMYSYSSQPRILNNSKKKQNNNNNNNSTTTNNNTRTRTKKDFSNNNYLNKQK